MDLTDFLLARIAEDEEAIDKHLVAATRQTGTTWQPRWSTSRLIAETTARRRIVALFDESARTHKCDTDELFFGETLNLLALPYASHPDYDPSWRP